MTAADDMQGFSDWLSKTSEPDFGNTGVSTASPIGPQPTTTAPTTDPTPQPAPSTDSPLNTSAIPGVSEPVATVPSVTAATAANTATQTADDPTTQAQPKGIAPQQQTVQPSTSNQVTDLFTDLPTLQHDYANLDQFNQQYVTATKAALAQQQQTTQQGEAAAETLRQSKVATATQLTNAADDLARKTAPIDQQREAVAARQLEIATGNPFVMFFKGVLDKNYRPDYLQEKSAALDTQERAIHQTYNDIVTSNTAKMQAAQDAYLGIKTAIDTKQADAEAQARLTGAVAVSGNQILATDLGKIQATQDLAVAQHTAQQNLLESMTQQDTNKYYAQALQNPNQQVVVNGTVLTAGQLKENAMSWDQRNLSLKNLHNAAIMGDIDTQNAMEKQYYSHLGLNQLQEIQAKGVLPNGHPVNQAILGQSIVDAKTNADNTAKLAAQQGIIPLYQAQAHQLATDNAQGMDRAQSLLGNVSLARQQLDHQIAVELTQQADTVRKAVAQGGSAAGQAALVDGATRLGELRKQVDALNLAEATSWGGGDKDLTDLAHGYMSGIPVNSATATRATVKILRAGGSLPGTVTASQVGQQDVLRKIVFDYDNGVGVDPMTAGQRAKSKSSGFVDQQLAEQVGAKMNQQHTGSTLNNLVVSAPQIAKSIMGADGQPHPASNIDPRDLAASNTIGTQQADRWLQGVLNMTPTQIQDINAKGTSSIFWQQYAKTHSKINFTVPGQKDPTQIPADLTTLKSYYQGVETQNMLTALDHTSSATPTFRPSAALVNLWGNQQYQQYAMRAAAASGSQSVGDYATQSVAGNNTASGIIKYSKRLSDAQSSLDTAQIGQRLASINAFRNITPVESARLALYTNPGLKGHEADALISAVLPAAQQVSQSQNIPLSDAIDSAITKTKLADPTLEKIRKTAAYDWDQRRAAMDAGINTWTAKAYQTYGTPAGQQVYNPTRDLRALPGVLQPVGGQ